MKVTATPLPDISGDFEPWANSPASDQARRGALTRHASGRRIRVDPTTCERDYSEAELEFMFAMHDYRQKSRRLFPTWSEVLEVLQGLGYQKLPSFTPSEA